MKSMGVNEIREKFLSFFESKGCLRLGSFPLIPKNDASLLLINSGMAPMKPWFQTLKQHLKDELRLVRNVSEQVILKMSVRLHVTALSLKCSVTSLSEITLKKRQLLGRGNSSLRLWKFRRNVFGFQCMKKMTRQEIFG